MEFLGEVIAWFGTGDHWTGSRGILFRTWEHVYVSVLSTGAAAAAALPPALVLAHRRKAEFLATGLVNVGRAIPSFGIIVVAGILTIRWGLGMGFWPNFAALFVLALPPIFTNAYTGVRGVDRGAVEAARGMGMTEREVLLRIEVPLGAPVTLAGLRIAFVQVIATATLGAILTFGGLGRYIIDGFGQSDEVQVFAGALLVASLAMLGEGAFTLVERRLLPAGVQRLVRKADVVETVHAA